jgi:hypothetical protein
MKYVIRLLLLITVLQCSFSRVRANNIDSLLFSLDSVILLAPSFIESREARISLLRHELKSTPKWSRMELDLGRRLFIEYRPFVCDSALHYQNRNIEIAEYLQDAELVKKLKIEQALLFGTSGLYNEAIELLSSINVAQITNELLLDYNYCYMRVYSELALYTQDRKSANRYWSKVNEYETKIKTIIDRNSNLYLRMREDSLRNMGNFRDALLANQQWLESTAKGMPEYALAAFHRALIFRWQGDMPNYKRFLILSAISDIKAGIRDQASLRLLAEIMFDEGDIDRAYNYIRFAWNATVMYNARLRNLQTSTILSLIEKTYQTKIKHQNNKLQSYLILISSLFVFLIIAMLVIFKQMKRIYFAKNIMEKANDELHSLNSELNYANSELQKLNRQLSTLNIDLLDSNKIKEVYIGRFIELCSLYINKIDDFRKKIYRKLIEGKIKDAQSLSQSQEVLDAEYEDLYRHFDNAFLQLYPDFVEKINGLLNESERYVLKSEELLNPELRIIALMRLGISDGTKISLFLRYSLTTIYNYRTKIKHRTNLSKEEFDKKIFEIR